MVVPEKGEVLFHGKSIKNDFEYRAQIGYMPQIGRYPDNMTIGQIFEMMKDIRKSDNTHLAMADSRRSIIALINSAQRNAELPPWPLS